MSTYYEIYADVQYKGKWYSLNPIVKKADGTYKTKEVFWAQSGFRQMYYDFEDMATDRGLPEDLSPEVRAMFHDNLDDICDCWGGQHTYRDEYDRTVLIVPYNKLRPHIVRDRPYKHMGYVYRELIPSFEVGEIDDIENWITIDEYKALPEDEKTSYAYYEWNNHWDDYDYKRNIVSKISFLSNLFSSGDSVEGNRGWIDVEDSDIRLIVVWKGEETMNNEIGMILMSGCNGLLGMSKKALAALGNPDSFCLYINIEHRQLAITPGFGSSSAVDLSHTSETQEYYWVRGLTVQRIISKFEIYGECKLVYFPAKHVTAENAITCSLANSVEYDLSCKDILPDVKKFIYANFQLKDRRNRLSPDALDVKCCKLVR